MPQPPSRNPAGFSNTTPRDPLAMFGMLDPTKWHVYFNDFNPGDYTAGDWVVTTTEGGGGDAAEELIAGDGGWLRITNDVADNDFDSLQGTPAAWSMAAGKRAFFKCRWKTVESIQCDILVGLLLVNTTPFTLSSDTDGIFFMKDDGDTNLDIYLCKNATTGRTSASAITTISDDTFLTTAWYYDGLSECKYYVDDVHLGTLAATSTYLPDATNLTITLAIMQGEITNAKTLTVDYVFMAKER